MKKLLVILAACGGTQKGAPSNSGGGAETARIGEGLVTAGKSWTYDATAADGSHTTMSCKVASVMAIAGGNIGTVTCDSDLDGVAGLWALTSDGLYFVGGPGQDAAPLGDNTRVLAFPTDENTLDQSVPDAGRTIKTRRDGDGWCVEDTESGEDGSAVTTTCFDADGIRNGSQHVTTSDAPARDSSYTRR